MRGKGERSYQIKTEYAKKEKEGNTTKPKLKFGKGKITKSRISRRTKKTRNDTL